MIFWIINKHFFLNLDVVIVSVVLVFLVFTLVAVGYFCYKKKNKDDLSTLESGAGRVSGGGTKKDRNTFVPNFVGKTKQV